MRQATLITIIVSVLMVLAVFFMCGWYIGEGCKKCPPVPVINDSLRQAPACTVRVDSGKIKIRDSIRIWKVRVHDTIIKTDTIPIFVQMRDTGKTFTIPDTTMRDGAKIGLNVRAKLIIPPVTASIFYTPPVDTMKKYVYHDTLKVNKNNWNSIAIGSLGGFAVGIAAAITAILFLKK